MKHVLLLLAACSSSAPAPPAKPAPPPVVVAADAAVPDAAIDQEASLAAIQKAMNDLDPAARKCWAAAAAERFDVEGNFEARISIDDHVVVEIVTDTTHNKTLVACMVAVFEGYQWAPPLRGQTIQLPFKFRAPDGQNVIDRRLVPVKSAQAGVTIATLLDENNTNNDAASMLEVTLGFDGASDSRQAARTELWFFLTTAIANGATVEAGDMLLVPPKSLRAIRTPSPRDEARAILVYVPGGREGIARAGALEAREVAKGENKAKLLRAADAKTYGPATISLDKTIVKDTPLAAEILQLPAGGRVAEHVHEHETEMLYMLAGSGTLTVGGVSLPVTATSVVQIPPNTKHAFEASEAIRALQIYTPPGPEQRFKKP